MKTTQLHDPGKSKFLELDISKALKDSLLKESRNRFKFSELVNLYKKRKEIQKKIDALLPPLQKKMTEVNDLIHKMQDNTNMAFEDFIEKKIIEGFSKEERAMYDKEHQMRMQQIENMEKGNQYSCVTYNGFDPEYDDFEIIDMETDQDGNVRLMVSRTSDRESISGIMTYYPKVYKTAWITKKEIKELDNNGLGLDLLGVLGSRIV